MSSAQHEPRDQASKFTRRHLRQLSQYSTSCPLRVIALVDYDAFYAQCETLRLRLPPTQPLAVRQWNAVIAVNYPARALGVKRSAHVDQVLAVCPDIALPHVATWREGHSTWAYRTDMKGFEMSDKAALDPYRQMSRKSLRLVKATLPATLQRIEKASVDEVFLDLSAQVHSLLIQRYADLAVDHDSDELDLPLPLPPGDPIRWGDTQIGRSGCASYVLDQQHGQDWDDVALGIGAEIVQGLRQAIWAEMGLTCSAGIAHNKTLAKLAAGLNKPNRQTVVPGIVVEDVLAPLPIRSIRGLGGKLGDKVLAAFGSDEVKDLFPIPIQAISKELGEQCGTWLFNLIRGHDTSDVVQRTDLQSMLSAKTFTPAVRDEQRAIKWLRIFAADLIARMNDLDEETGRPRRPLTISLHHHVHGRFGPTRSKQKSIPAAADLSEVSLLQVATSLLRQISAEGPPAWPCEALSLSVSNFVSLPLGNHRITSFLSPTDHHVYPNKRTREETPDAAHSAQPEVDDNSFIEAAADARVQPESALPRAAKSALASDSENATAYTCPFCAQCLDADAVLEHLDWHVAVDLQEQPVPRGEAMA